MLATLNAQLESRRQPALTCVGELFGRVRANVLATFPELDHYPDHERGEYWGTRSGAGGMPSAWPDGSGPRLFAYLKPFRGLDHVLDELAARGLPSVVHVGGGFDGRHWQHTRVRSGIRIGPFNDGGRIMVLRLLRGVVPAEGWLSLRSSELAAAPLGSNRLFGRGFELGRGHAQGQITERGLDLEMVPAEGFEPPTL